MTLRSFEFWFPDGPPQHFALHLYVEASEILEPLLAAIDSLKTQAQTEGAQVALDIQALTDAVTASVEGDKAAVLLINGIVDQLNHMAENNVDPAALRELATQLSSASAPLAAAVFAGSGVVVPPVDDQPADLPVEPTPPMPSDNS